MRNILAIFIYLFIYQGNASALVIGSDLNEITIGANFSGQDLLVFGAFYSDPSLPRDAKGDVIIEVKGPPQTVQVRKKKSFFGFWLNNAEVTFKEVPGFYYLISTTEINDEILNKNNITLLSDQDTQGIEWGKIRMPKASLNRAKVGAIMEDFDFDLKLNVLEFKVKVPGSPTITCKGTSLCPQATKAVNRVRSGSEIVIVGRAVYPVPELLK